jgi:tetratricopeptide (TPR) repeat protein
MCLAHSHAHLGQREMADTAACRALEGAERWGDAVALGCTHYVLTLESFWRGRFVAGMTHGANATAILRPTAERFILGHAIWSRGLNAAAHGDFADAVHAAEQTRVSGEESGNARLLSFGLWLAGWVSSLTGDGNAAIEHCRLAVERAPDPLSQAIASQWLGFALLETGDHVGAESLLSSAVDVYQQFHFTELHGWAAAWLATARAELGARPDVRDLAEEAEQLCASVGFEYGRGLALRAACAAGPSVSRRADAEAALNLFVSIDARYEVARTHMDAAALAHADADGAAARAHLETAHRLFTKLDVPFWAQRTASAAQELGIVPPGR